MIDVLYDTPIEGEDEGDDRSVIIKIGWPSLAKPHTYTISMSSIVSVVKIEVIRLR